MEESDPSSMMNREPVTLRTDLAERLGAICAHAEAIGVEPRTVDGYVDWAVESFLKGFDKELAKDDPPTQKS